MTAMIVITSIRSIAAISCSRELHLLGHEMQNSIYFLLWSVCGIATVLIPPLDAAKILGIFPFPGPSQYIFAEPFFKELANRGHDVTVINVFPQKQPVKNFRDISIANIRKIQESVVRDLQLKASMWEELNFMKNFGRAVTENVLENHEVKELLQSEGQKFDVIIMEALVNEALFGLAQHFGAHLIGISTFGTYPPLDYLVGNTSPISYIPYVTLAITDRMTFAQRLWNLYAHTLAFVHMHLYHLPEQEALYRKYFPQARHSMLELRRNFSLVLLNQHFSLSFPRPYVPNMIEVGGMHIKRRLSGISSLTLSMQRFLNESGDAGVIYFSMGTNILSKDLPPERLEIILRTFAGLKQRVMWKFENSDLPGKPANVFISKWFPQSDILAHPKVKLFITHGGLLSTVEAIYHGKPVLGIPIFYDQFLNVERAKAAGFGLGVDLNQLTEDEFKQKISELLTEPKYKNQAEIMSRRYLDQPMEPMDTAIYWTEYVLRHNGATHMRVSAQDLNIVQYFSLDTIAVLFGGLILALTFLLWSFVKLISVVMNKISGHKSDAVKQKFQ